MLIDFDHADSDFPNNGSEQAALRPAQRAGGLGDLCGRVLDLRWRPTPPNMVPFDEVTGL